MKRSKLLARIEVPILVCAILIVHFFLIPVFDNNFGDREGESSINSESSTNETTNDRSMDEMSDL
ncbi:MAG: hypothetical protein ACXAC2_25070 [Candidatus Kariarchaeaceae archaeon]|jgi:hypothetical protein